MNEENSSPFFNLNNIFRMNSVDGKFSTSLGTYSGKARFSVFERQADGQQSFGKPAASIFLYEKGLIVLENKIKIVLSKTDAMTTSFGICFWDSDARQYQPNSKVVIGRDEKKEIFIEISAESLKEPVRFYFTGPPNIIIDEEVPNEQVRSEIGARAFLKALDQINLVGIPLSKQASIMRNAPAPQGRPQKSENTGGSNVVDDDIPY